MKKVNRKILHWWLYLGRPDCWLEGSDHVSTGGRMRVLDLQARSKPRVFELNPLKCNKDHIVAREFYQFGSQPYANPKQDIMLSWGESCVITITCVWTQGNENGTGSDQRRRSSWAATSHKSARKTKHSHTLIFILFAKHRYAVGQYFCKSNNLLIVRNRKAKG